MIDKKGNEILPPVYEELEWNCLFGTVKASVDGSFGLFDRNGNSVVPMIYHSMGSIDNELIVVGVEDRFGYIRHDGTVIIPPVYDEAYDFQNGKAGYAMAVSNLLFLIVLSLLMLQKGFMKREASEI